MRFWPAVVQRMVSDAGGGEWEVEFAEDKVGSNQVWSSHGSKMIDPINPFNTH